MWQNFEKEISTKSVPSKCTKMSKKSFFKLVWILILQTLAMLYHLVVAPFAIMYAVVYDYIDEIKITINHYKYDDYI